MEIRQHWDAEYHLLGEDRGNDSEEGRLYFGRQVCASLWVLQWSDVSSFGMIGSLALTVTLSHVLKAANGEVVETTSYHKVV
jgi:hypothetical protein